jgi:hypothetical protein
MHVTDHQGTKKNDSTLEAYTCTQHGKQKTFIRGKEIRLRFNTRQTPVLERLTNQFVFSASKRRSPFKSAIQDQVQPVYIQKLSRIPFIAHFFVLLACVISTFVAVLVKVLENVNTLQIVSHRNMIIFLLALPITVFWNKTEMFPKGNRLHLLGRALCGNFNLYIMYYAFRKIPLGKKYKELPVR